MSILRIYLYWLNHFRTGESRSHGLGSLCIPENDRSLTDRCQTSSTLLAALDEQITHIRQTNKKDQTNAQLYNDRRNKAYLTATREIKKGSKAQGGNYNPAPPAYGDEAQLTFDEGRL